MEDQILDRATRQIELQRLIDGRMPALERAAFLECIDDEPTCWRNVALAYVEDQVMKAELNSPSLPEPKVLPVSRKPTNGRIGRVVMLACLLLALLVGGVAGRWTNSIGSPTASAPRFKVNELSPPETNKPEPPIDGDYFVLLNSPGGESAANEPSPWEVISASMQQPVFGDETRESIRNFGYDVHEEPVLFVLEDEQGGHYMIPQRHVTFVSHPPQQ